MFVTDEFICFACIVLMVCFAASPVCLQLFSAPVLRMYRAVYIVQVRSPLTNPALSCISRHRSFLTRKLRAAFRVCWSQKTKKNQNGRYACAIMCLMNFSVFAYQQFCDHFYCATAKHTHSIAVEILSVRPSVCLSNTCIVTKRNNSLSIFQHHTTHRCF